MTPQNTRINAVICYFLLWPLFLLAKKWTPLADPFVQQHARRSSLYIAIFLGVLLVFFQIREHLYWDILGISLYTIVLTIIFVIFLSVMIFSSYQAFRWEQHSDNIFVHTKALSYFDQLSITEEQTIQIIASFLPLVGIFLASKFPSDHTKTGRKIGNLFFFFILLFAAIFGSFINFLSFFVLIVYALLLVTIAVFLMAEKKFLSSKIYDYIPSYHQLEAKFFAFFHSTFEFFRVAFGKTKTKTFKDLEAEYLAHFDAQVPPEIPFWTHAGIIGIPVFNFITIPSFFNKKFHEYQGNIAEGFLLTLFAIGLWYFVGNYYWMYLLIFPIVTLIAEAKHNTNVRAPFTSIARNIFVWVYKTKAKINTISQKSEEKLYRFEIKNENTPDVKKTEDLWEKASQKEEKIKNISENISEILPEDISGENEKLQNL